MLPKHLHSRLRKHPHSRRFRVYTRAFIRRDQHGQMTVELAVLVPVVIVVALTVFNLMRYVSACSAFDRIAADAVIAQGVAPAGGAQLTAVSEVEQSISSALDMRSCTVSVQAESAAADSKTAGLGVGFPLSPLLTRFECTLSYTPWPSSLVIAGMTYKAPLQLQHTRTLVVDRYRGGVVV